MTKTGQNQVITDYQIDDGTLVLQAAGELKLRAEYATRAIELLDGGATIPFIARYRKEVTGGMDEEQLRQLEKRVAYGRQLASRKAEVLATIEEQGKLTPDLEKAIRQATTLQEVEDLYLPYRPKRRTRATIAREKGLEPLANMILAQKTFKGQPSEYAAKFIDPAKGVSTLEEALAGARDIVAESVSEEAELRRRLRETVTRQAGIKAGLTKNARDEARKYEQYYEYNEPLTRIPPHRMLALNRGEKEGVLSVSLEAPLEQAEKVAAQIFVTDTRSIFRDEFRSAITDSLKRLVLPSIENEVRAAMTEQAEAHAIRIFAANLRQLLLQPPIQGKVVLGLDPGFRTGCKVAVVDPTGKPLANLAIYPHEPKNDWAGSKKTLLELISRFKVGVLAIGNGTASRETEALAAEVIAACPEPRPAYVIVSEAGASVYSASELARQEFPNLDATQRGNISIARRLQDPLAELVKIDPKSIGVGLYQHDVDQKQLSEALDAVVESCVNYVGVDLNTASSALLRYVSGINKKVADAIVAYREKNGPFKSRAELRKVAGLGDKTFEQAAGFLKIQGGANPLDNTFIHPESYAAAQKLLNLLAGSGQRMPSSAQVKEFRRENAGDEHKLANLAHELGLGVPTLRDILDNLEKPGRDPREELPKPILRQDVLKLEDLAPGMILKGTVRNVIDFGAFVDIGVKQDGLVHITEMSDRYVKHPLEVVSVGDIIDVRVLQVDAKRGRISLSMKLNSPAK
ncbi:MAG TPA: Tex family protein [Chloroflexia bacterium]|nr:Tex family protein [Chloroflexia bacterium]